jgi:hypothetical protein
MSRKYAIITDNNVTSIETLEDIQVSDRARQVQMLIDIENMLPQPQIGWKLVGNKLQLNNSSMSSDELDAYQQTTQRLFGLSLLPKAVDKIGARNLKLDREGAPADVAALASQMASIKILMESGALKTVRMICTAIQPAHPNHADILQEVVVEISNFLALNDFE